MRAQKYNMAARMTVFFKVEAGLTTISDWKNPQRVLPNPEMRHWICQVKAGKRQRPPPLTDPFANPRTAAFAVPRQQRDQSPGEREPERPRERTPGGIGASAGEAHRSAHSQRSRAQTMLFSQTGNTKNVSIPTRLDNAGSDKRTV